MKASILAVIGIVVIIALTGGLYLVFRPAASSKVATTPTPTPSQVLQQATVSATPASTQVATPTPTVHTNLTVTGKEYSMSPNKLQVAKGSIVKITFTNNGTMPHNFTIPSLGAGSKTVSPGQSDTVQFTATTSGTFDFYCSIGNHRSLGMSGTITVQ
jgi:plastocyanin